MLRAYTTSQSHQSHYTFIARFHFLIIYPIGMPVQRAICSASVYIRQVNVVKLARYIVVIGSLYLWLTPKIYAKV